MDYCGFNIRSVESCTAASSQSSQVNSAMVFQYSLCRIVYCCDANGSIEGFWFVFQYSLCRIVYCCVDRSSPVRSLHRRFNIRSVESCTAARCGGGFGPVNKCFNIRSVESCTAAPRRLEHRHDGWRFNIRSVESCTAAARASGELLIGYAGFNIRSVESCTAAAQKSIDGITALQVSIFALSNRVLLLEQL